jgi:excisionase family DNA binding protein
MTWLAFRMTSANPRTDSAEAGRVQGVSKQLTADEAAEVLRIGPFQVVLLCRTGQLRASKPGKSWLIDPADLRAYLDAHRNTPAEESA